MISTQVNKNRPEWQDTRPKDPELRRTYNLADRAQPRFKRLILSALREITSSIQADRALVRALREGLNAGAVIRRLMPDFEEQINAFAKRMAKAHAELMEQSGNEELKILGLTLKSQHRGFDIANVHSMAALDEIERFWRERISADIEENLRDIISAGLAEQKTVAEIADDILDADLRLIPQHRRSIDNQRDLLIEEAIEAGASPSRARAIAMPIVERRARKLLSWRAETISRTEVIRAQAQGIQDSWLVARDKGIIPETTKRVWIASTGSDRTCPICLSLDGKVVGLEQTFRSSYEAGTGETKRVVQTSAILPPAHARCRCTVGLQI